MDIGCDKFCANVKIFLEQFWEKQSENTNSRDEVYSASNKSKKIKKIAPVIQPQYIICIFIVTPL